MSQHSIPLWDGLLRADGVEIVESDPPGQFAFKLSANDFLLIHCPCCGHPFFDLAYAQEVADRIYPFAIPLDRSRMN